MKRAISILLALAVLCLTTGASWQAVLTGIVSDTGNAVDTSRGYEVNSDPSGWATTSDVEGKINIYSTAQAAHGTHSFVVTPSGTVTKAYQTYDAGANRTAASYCFWFYSSTSSTGDDSLEIFNIGTSTGGSSNLRVYWSKASGSYYFRLRGTSFPSGVTAITTGAWYRLEVQYVKNSTSTLKIFDAAGTQQGSDITVTASNNATDRYVNFGLVGNSATTGWSDLYWDSVGMAWSGTPAYPLWSYTISN